MSRKGHFFRWNVDINNRFDCFWMLLLELLAGLTLFKDIARYSKSIVRSFRWNNRRGLACVDNCGKKNDQFNF